MKKFTIKEIVAFLGPAFVVSVAYIDPGNFATNIAAGSKFNYSLVWVILWSNLMAIFLQTLSAKLGIATRKNLTTICRERFSIKVNIFLYFIGIATSIATAMAEFLGATLGIYLLFDISLKISAIIALIITYCLVFFKKYGQRAIEIIITSFIAIICISYAVELFFGDPNGNMIVLGTFIPHLKNGEAVLIATGMLGATVMPHVIYLHSELVQYRNEKYKDKTKKQLLNMEKIDIVVAMNIAFIVNAAMVIVAAAVFYKNGQVVDTIEVAYKSLQPLLGKLAGDAFAIALLASGFSSTIVSTMAGDNLLDGFIDVKLNEELKKIIILLPTLVIIFIGINPFNALIISQVVLSFALPAAIIPLMIFTSKKEVMGEFTNKLFVKVIGWIIVLMIIALNGTLLYMTFIGA